MKMKNSQILLDFMKGTDLASLFLAMSPLSVDTVQAQKKVTAPMSV